jgi:glycosyltransferase involved in cell wall biosynthesis
MRIAINTLGMKGKLHGVGNYIKNLVCALSKLDSHNQYFLFASSENVRHLEGLGENFCIELAPNNRALRVVWEQTLLPLKLKQHKVDVYHGPAFAAPLLKTCPQVVSIHDMTVHLLPEQHSLHTRWYLRTLLPAMLRASDVVITVSESAKADILKFEKLNGDKVCVIPLGVEERFQPIRDECRLSMIRKKYGLERDFILFVGMIEPRKNLENLVDTFLRDSLPQTCDLVLAGSLGWGYSQLLGKIGTANDKGSIRMLGYVDDTDLPALYNAATAFVYPSFYEGFGLPILEAMACGTPVITSSVSSLPEVAGDAALLVDPADAKALAFALRRIVKDSSLRQDLSRRGQQRSGLFTWQQSAEKTLAVYGRIARADTFNNDRDVLGNRSRNQTKVEGDLPVVPSSP